MAQKLKTKNKNLKNKDIYKQAKGITLIALVITIIVLLILAAVSIATLTGDNGLLNKAQEAKVENDKAGERDQIQLAYQAAKMEEYQDTEGTRTFKEIFEEELEKNGLTGAVVTDNGDGSYTVTLGNGNSYKIDGNGNITDNETIEDGEEVGEKFSDIYSSTTEYKENGVTVAWIPKGFAVGTSEGINSVEDGLVITDKIDESTHKSIGNEFVWVPVSEINEMAQCSQADGTCNLDLANNEIVCKTHNNNSKIVGKLYASTVGDSFDANTPNTTYNENSGLRDPAIVTGNSDGTGTSYDGGVTNNLSIINTILGENYTTANEFLGAMQIDYIKMIKSVEKYKGFYVSRYEMSKDSNNRAASVEGKPLVNDSNNNWYGLYAYGKTYRTSSVESSMIWGSQYDAMMRWMYDNGKGTDVKKDIGNNRNDTQTTGAKKDTDIINNVYDLYGCHFEWTLEANDTNSRVLRGRLLLQKPINYSPRHQASDPYA